MGETGRSPFQPGDRVTSVVGEEFLITLTEPGAAGYLFEPVGLPGSVSLVSVSRYPSEVPGGSGTALFRFRAERPGTGELTFELRAPWEEEAADMVSLTFAIEP
jgi:hypothetical protein